MRQAFFASIFWINLLRAFFKSDLRGDFFSVFFIARFLYLSWILYFQLVHVFKSGLMRSFAHRMCTAVPSNLKSKLLCVSTVGAMLSLADSTLMVIWQVTNFSSGGPFSQAFDILFFFFVFHLLSPLLVSMTLYTLFFILLHNSLRMKTVNLLRAAHFGDDQSILQTTDELRADRCEFESLLNLNPLFWLANEFLATLLVLIFYNHESKIHLVSLSLTYVCLTCSLLYLTHLMHEITSWGDQIKSAYTGSGCIKKIIPYHICQSIDCAYKSDFTAWRTFRIDRSLIASYFGTTLTFTVLLLQLSSGALTQNQ